MTVWQITVDGIHDHLDTRPGDMALWDRGVAMCGDVKVGSWSYAPQRRTT